MKHCVINNLIDIAWQTQTLTLPNPSVASAIYQNQILLAIGTHQRFGAPHAEILALKNAYFTLTKDNRILEIQDALLLHKFLETNHNGIFKDCEIYITLEPCNHFGKTPPCADLLEKLQFKEIIYGASDTFGKSSGGSAKLQNVSFHIEKQKCQDLLYPFLCLKNTGRFVLFKLAMRLNGEYKNGRISSQKCIEFSHNQRTRADHIIISGETLRQDDPILDTRFATFDTPAKLPNIIVFTRDINMDLKPFNIYKNHRNITLSDSILDIQNLKGFVIIEGGWTLFHALKDAINMMLIHINPSIQKSIFHTEILDNYDFKAQYISSQDKDISLWLKL